MTDWGFPNQATTEGSSLYYVVRFCPTEQRDRLAALFALRHKWQQLAGNSDPGVARLQFDWWRQELGRLSNDQVRHPVLLGLLPEAAQPGPQACLAHLLDSAEQEQRGLRFHHQDELEGYCRDSGGSLVRLILAIGGITYDPGWADRLGAALRLVELLQQLAPELQRGRCPLPGDWLASHGLDSGDLRAAPDTATRNLLDHALQQGEDWLRAAEPAHGWPSGSLQRWWRLQRAWLSVARDDPAVLLTHQVFLTPLRCLFQCVGTRKRGAAV